MRATCFRLLRFGAAWFSSQNEGCGRELNMVAVGGIFFLLPVFPVLCFIEIDMQVAGMRNQEMVDKSEEQSRNM